MAEVIGNSEKVYISSSAVSALSGVQDGDLLVGETTNSISLNSNLIEISDKSTPWQKFIAGVKGATLSVTVNVNKGDVKQTSLLTSFTGGAAVHCFVGSKTTGGFAFDAIISSIAVTNDNAAVATWGIEMSATGEVEYISA